MTKELVALAGSREVGRVHRDSHGKLSFAYEDEWRGDPEAFPISVSMPLALAEHGNAKIDPYLWGLLPDNEQILDKWGRKYHVSARNAFGLVSHVGEDSPGAVQFVLPERVERIKRSSPADVQWLSEGMIAERLKALRADHGAWRLPNDTGQFSLAGAQPKTALLFVNGRWGLPSGRVPTTHILKPPTGEFDGHAENEHFCLELARALGFAVPNSRIMKFEDEMAIVVERYDRVQTAPAAFQRIHQEDICQALAISPTRKYENEGGTGGGAGAGGCRRSAQGRVTAWDFGAAGEGVDGASRAVCEDAGRVTPGRRVRYSKVMESEAESMVLPATMARSSRR